IDSLWGLLLEPAALEVVEGGEFVSICGRQLNTIGNSTIDAFVTHVAAGYGSVFATCHPVIERGSWTRQRFDTLYPVVYIS
ncbi:MAG: hypothetical protein IKO71_04250, partial [Bacteroidaceae bacterium]|nr:hypothetical protein [Bacteroidaceae bacterium]